MFVAPKTMCIDWFVTSHLIEEVTHTSSVSLDIVGALRHSQRLKIASQFVNVVQINELIENCVDEVVSWGVCYVLCCLCTIPRNSSVFKHKLDYIDFLIFCHIDSNRVKIFSDLKFPLNYVFSTKLWWFYVLDDILEGRRTSSRSWCRRLYCI